MHAEPAPETTRESVPSSTDSPGLDDTTLLARCQQGDELAWATVVERYQGLVYSTAIEVGLDGDDAADVFQFVWIELYRSIPRFRDPIALPRWLMVATRRCSYKVATRNRRHIRGTFEDLTDPAALAQEQVEAAEDRLRVENALHRLDRRCRWFLRRLFFSSEKITYDELARQTGLATGTIGPLRVRCLNKLRRILGEDR